MSWNTNGESKAEKPSNKVKLGRWLATTGITIAVLAGGAIYFLQKPEVKAKIKGAKGPAKIVEVEADLTALPENNVADETKAESTEPENDPRYPYTDGRKVLSSRTNNWNQVIDICVMPNGKTRKVIRSSKPPIFQHATDQLLSVALSGSDDEELPPLPIDDDMEVEFLESLKTPIVINDDDSEEVKEAKMRAIEGRKIMDEELRKGVSFREILQAHLDQRRLNSEVRSEAMAAVNEVKKDGDPEMLYQYVEMINDKLRSRGFSEISEQDLQGKRKRK